MECRKSRRSRTRNGKKTASISARLKSRVLKHRRKRMADRIADHSIHARLPAQFVRAIQILHVIATSLGRAQSRFRLAHTRARFPHATRAPAPAAPRRPSAPQSRRVARAPDAAPLRCAPSESHCAAILIASGLPRRNSAATRLQILGRALEKMRRRDPPPFTQQHVQQFRRTPRGTFNFQIVPVASSPHRRGQLHQLLRNRAAKLSARFAPPASRDQSRAQAVSCAEPCSQKSVDLVLVGEPIQAQFDRASRRAEPARAASTSPARRPRPPPRRFCLLPIIRAILA